MDGTHVFEDLLEEVLWEVSFDAHREMRETPLQHTDVTLSDGSDGLDIFGQSMKGMTSNEQFKCVNCDRPVVASRYAPHLEKCMGLGRSSGRVASRRLNTLSEKNTPTDNDTDDDSRDMDYEEEKDEAYVPGGGGGAAFGGGVGGGGGAGGGAGGKRKGKVGAASSSSATGALKATGATGKGANKKGKRARKSFPTGGVVTLDEQARKRAKLMLEEACGVVSTVTGKQCVKSLACPHHSDTQRYAIRDQLLGSDAGRDFARQAGLSVNGM